MNVGGIGGGNVGCLWETVVVLVVVLAVVFVRR